MSDCEHEYTSSGKDMYPHLSEMKKKTEENDPYREIDGVKGGCGHTTEEIINDANGCGMVMLIFIAGAVGTAVLGMIFG